MPILKSNRLVSYKQDIAPMGFYFDIFSTSLFQIPIFPIPLRIDKVLKGEPSLLVIPNQKRLERLFKRLGICIDFRLFYMTAIKNLLNYARSKQVEVAGRRFDDSILRKKWWQASNCISTNNPDLSESFTFIITQFIKCYYIIKKDNLDPIIDKDNYINTLTQYCESIIEYFRNKIEKNLFFTKNEGKINLEKLYIERRNKYFPLEIMIPIYDSNTGETYDRKFVPYLIYDDLLDSFSYNKKLLMNADIPINLKVYEDNKIINKISTFDDIRTISSKIELKKINLEEIF